MTDVGRTLVRDDSFPQNCVIPATSSPFVVSFTIIRRYTVVLELVPKKLNWDQVRTFGTSLSPVYSVHLLVFFHQPSGVLRIIILLEKITIRRAAGSSQESLRPTIKSSVHISSKNKEVCCPPLKNPSSDVDFIGMLCTALHLWWLAVLSDG